MGEREVGEKEGKWEWMSEREKGRDIWKGYLKGKKERGRKGEKQESNKI